MGDFAEDSDGTTKSNSSKFYLRLERSRMTYRKRFKTVVKCWTYFGEELKKDLESLRNEIELKKQPEQSLFHTK